jgi:hypothetical protein
LILAGTPSKGRIWLMLGTTKSVSLTDTLTF